MRNTWLLHALLASLLLVAVVGTGCSSARCGPREIDRGTFDIYQVQGNQEVVVGRLWSGGAWHQSHSEAWALFGNYQPATLPGPSPKIYFRQHATQYPTETSFRNAVKPSTANYMLHTARRIP